MSVIAYMDDSDSIWLTQNKSNLQAILDTASSFYKYNNIRVNPNKSVLITNAKIPDPQICFDGTTIYAQKRSEPLKYLGAWFSVEQSHKYIQKIIIAEFRTSLKKLQIAK